MFETYLIVRLIAFGSFVTVVDCIDCEIVMVSTSTQLSPSSTSTRKFDFTGYSELELKILSPYGMVHTLDFYTFHAHTIRPSNLYFTFKSLKSPDLTTSTAVSQTSEPYISCLTRLVTELSLNGSDVTLITTTEYRMEFRIIDRLLYLKDFSAKSNENSFKRLNTTNDFDEFDVVEAEDRTTQAAGIVTGITKITETTQQGIYHTFKIIKDI